MTVKTALPTRPAVELRSIALAMLTPSIRGADAENRATLSSTAPALMPMRTRTMVSTLA